MLNIIYSVRVYKLIFHMGVFGSKEDLGQIVVIYGSNANDFDWRDIDSRSIYQTSGLIVESNGKKFVVTTRQKLISCKNIVMYHCYFCGIEEPIMRNDLQIIFHSIEFNIILLVTKNRDELDLTQSEIISGYFDPKNSCPSYDITKNIYIVPTVKSHYYTIRMEMNLESEIINYHVHIYDVKFSKSMTYNKSYVPDVYMYEFILKNSNSKLIGICGAIIYNKKHQLIGIITRCESKCFYVLPLRALIKIFNDFLEHINKPNQYNGLLSVPFNYQINNELNCEIAQNIIVCAKNGNKLLKKNDIIISVAGHQIEIINKCVIIYDNIYKDNIPLNMFICLNFNKQKPIDITIKRKGKILKLNIFAVSQNEFMPITNVSHYFPTNCIPHINFNGIIIVQLTHELLDITMFNKIILQNNVISKYFDDEEDNYKVLLIIDCLDDTIAKKYNLPQFQNIGEKQIIICPFIITINEKIISSLSEFANIIHTSSTKTDDPIVLKVGPSYENQQIIILE
jgi:hypothetical protein